MKPATPEILEKTKRHLARAKEHAMVLGISPGVVLSVVDLERLVVTAEAFHEVQSDQQVISMILRKRNQSFQEYGPYIHMNREQMMGHCTVFKFTQDGRLDSITCSKENDDA